MVLSWRGADGPTHMAEARGLAVGARWLGALKSCARQAFTQKGTPRCCAGAQSCVILLFNISERNLVPASENGPNSKLLLELGQFSIGKNPGATGHLVNPWCSSEAGECTEGEKSEPGNTQDVVHQATSHRHQGTEDGQRKMLRSRLFGSEGGAGGRLLPVLWSHSSALHALVHLLLWGHFEIIQ